MKSNKIRLGEQCVVTSSKRFHLSERITQGVPFYCSKEIIKKFNGEDVTECDYISEDLRFLYKGIIIKHNKTEPTYTKTSLFLCEKRRFFMARTEKGVVTTI